MSYRFARSLATSFVRTFAHVEVEGLENMPSTGGFIVTSNHLGRMDVPLAFVFLDRQDITMMVAERYRNYAIFRWFVKQLDAIWIDRYNADFATLRVALNRLRQGNVLVIAPEGTRSKSEALIEARPGSSYLAAKAGATIVPVAITGTEDRLVVQRLKRLRKAQIHVLVGKPFTLPPLNGRDRDTQMKEFTDEIMCQIAALLPPEKRGFYAQHPRTLDLIRNTQK